MICRRCGMHFDTFFSHICPFCKEDNSFHEESFQGLLFSPLPQQKGIDRSSKVNSDDWEYYDNCSDREYDDDEDYDDFDN